MAATSQPHHDQRARDNPSSIAPQEGQLQSQLFGRNHIAVSSGQEPLAFSASLGVKPTDQQVQQPSVLELCSRRCGVQGMSYETYVEWKAVPELQRALERSYQEI